MAISSAIHETVIQNSSHGDYLNKISSTVNFNTGTGNKGR